MLNNSRLLTFIDSKKMFALHFLEGMKLIEESVLLSQRPATGFQFFREAALSTLPLLSLLKPGENFGFYFDSGDDQFQYKLEANYNGKMRTLLHPQDFSQFPDQLSGIARFIKFSQAKAQPYTSIIKIKEKTIAQIINQIIAESYQTTAKLIVSDISDQACLILKLPALNPEQPLDEVQSLEQFERDNRDLIANAFSRNLNELEDLVKHFESRATFHYLASRQVQFSCPCSKDLMLSNLSKLPPEEIDYLFNQKMLMEINCDYCQTKYQVQRSELVKRV